MKNKKTISKILIVLRFGLCSLSTMNLHAKFLLEDETIKVNKEELAAYSRYEQSFDTKLSKNSDKEATLEINFAKLGIKLKNINDNLCTDMQKNIKNLKLISKELSRCNKKNPDVIAMQNDIKFYTTNISQFLSLCKQHKNFIKGYQILNFYNDITAEKNKIVESISNKCNNFFTYPLVSYKGKVTSDLYWIKNNKRFFSEYTNMAKQLEKIQGKMKESLVTLQKTNELKAQEEKKYYDNLRLQQSSRLYIISYR